MSNHHLWRLAPLAVTLLEMRQFGPVYAKQVILNAQALAAALDHEGVPVVAKNMGYTASHQVLVDVSEFGGGSVVAQSLEGANIICNKNLLPWDDVDEAMGNPSGLRLGVQELTRFGFSQADMNTIAQFYRRIIIDQENPAQVKSEVTTFRQEFPQIRYSIDEEDPLGS